mgnify:CR=1 FL=1
MSAIDEYPMYAYYNYLTGSSLELGSFKDSGILGLFNIRVIHKNASPYSYQLRVVFSDREGGPELASTDWETFSNSSTGQSASFWMGHLTFTPQYYQLNPDIYTYARLESTGYTYAAGTTYLATWCDWLEPIGAVNSGAAKMVVGVYR